MEFNAKIHCEINVKLLFHEILWKKKFHSVYHLLSTPQNLKTAKNELRLLSKAVLSINTPST